MRIISDRVAKFTVEAPANILPATNLAVAELVGRELVGKELVDWVRTRCSNFKFD